jgi:hypothetical protein
LSKEHARAQGTYPVRLSSPLTRNRGPRLLQEYAVSTTGYTDTMFLVDGSMFYYPTVILEKDVVVTQALRKIGSP